MKKFILGTLILFSNLFAGNLKVAVASNVSYAMVELKKEFSKNYPQINLIETLSSSGKLTAQIKHGAPYDIFMSANMKYPNALYKDGLAVTKPVVYARGSLAYLSSKKIDFSKGTLFLKDMGKIAIANPKTAPYGKASIEVMENVKIYESVKPKLVYAESISQTIIYALNAADVGFVAKSALYSKKMQNYKKGINWDDINTKLYTPINQGIVLLKKAQKNNDAKAFYNFMLSDSAKKILKKYGYLVL